MEDPRAWEQVVIVAGRYQQECMVVCGVLTLEDKLSRQEQVGHRLIGSALAVLAELAKERLAVYAKCSGCLAVVLMMGL